MNCSRPLLVAACLLTATFAQAEETSENKPSLPKPNFSYKTVKTKEGLVFRVPSDMPIEERNGIQAPMPFDEYTYGKLQTLEARISHLDHRLSKIEEKLDRIGAAASPAPAPAADKKNTEVFKAGAE